MPAPKSKSRSRTPRTALDEALRLLRRKPVTVKQLREHLVEKGHEAAPIEAAIRDLRAQGLLSDRRLAESAALTSLTRADSTSHALRKLKARGVSRATAEKALRGAATDDARSDLQRAMDFARARLGGPLAGYSREVQRRRLSGLLARRGHDEETIESVLASLVPAADDHLPPLP